MTGREIAALQQVGADEARRIMCEPVINAVLMMWQDRILFLMECRNISWDEASKVLISEIERGE